MQVCTGEFLNTLFTCAHGDEKNYQKQKKVKRQQVDHYKQPAVENQKSNDKHRPGRETRTCHIFCKALSTFLCE